MPDVDQPLRTPDNVIPFPSASQEEPVEVDLNEEDDQQEDQPQPAQDFGKNLAEDMGSDELFALGQSLHEAIQEDLNGRQDWYDCYKDALKYVGLKEEKRQKPWEGAAGVMQPDMLSGITRFQSRTLVKLFPSSGPANLKLINVDTNPQIQMAMQKAQRKFNDYLLNSMQETQLETDRLLYSLAEVGYAVKKVYFDSIIGRTCTQLVRAEDFILPYGCDNLETAHRFTQRVRRTTSEVENLQRIKYYLDAEKLSLQTDVMDEIEEAKAELTGQKPSGLINEGYRMFEVYADLKIASDQHSPGDRSVPYVVTVDVDTHKVYSVYRNWNQQDPRFAKRVIFAPYIYVPGDGSYGYGIVHLVGQMASAATKILRQLIDAGTLSNLPALFASRDARMENNKANEPLAPGEIRVVGIDAENLQKSFFPLPFKEPSQVLFELYKEIVANIKIFIATADLDISASSQNAPVGTTLALLERQLEIANAVQKRLHTSFMRELNLIMKTIEEFQSDVFDSIFGEMEQIAGPGSFILVPAGDPTSATLSQRVLTLQALAQQAVQCPQVFDMAALQRSIATAMGIEDANLLIPDHSQGQPMGLVEEQMGFLSSKPVQCFPFYDHQAHIQAHQNLLNDPKYAPMFQTPQGQQTAAAILSDIAQHYAFDYKNQIEQQLGVQLPPLGQQLPPQADAALSQLVAQASGRVKDQHAQEAQQQAAQQQAADPAFALEKRDLDIKEKKVDNDHQQKMAKLQMDDRHKEMANQTQVLQIATQDQQASEASKRDLLRESLSHDREQTGMAIDIGKELLSHHRDREDADTNQVNNAAEIGKRLLDHKEHQESLSQQDSHHQMSIASDERKHQSALGQKQMQHEQSLASQEKQSEAQLKAKATEAKNKPKPNDNA